MTNNPTQVEPAERRFRHKKRGTEYTLIGVGRAQGTLSDEDPVVIYRGDDGSLWARHQAEFSDGRFEEIEALCTPAPTEASTLADEPVAWMYQTPDGKVELLLWRRTKWDVEAYQRTETPLYAHPPAQADAREAHLADVRRNMTKGDRECVALPKCGTCGDKGRIPVTTLDSAPNAGWADCPICAPAPAEASEATRRMAKTLGTEFVRDPKWSAAEAVEDMLETARNLRENANGDCRAIEQAIMWEGRAAALKARSSDETARLRERVRVLEEALRQAFEEAGCIYPYPPRTFEHQSLDYSAGWFAAITAYKAAIRAKAGEER